MNTNVPHLRVVVAFCAIAVAAYAGFSVYVVAGLKDPALTGDVIGTWKSFAVAVMAFWVGSSSGSKAKDGNTTGEPIQTEVVNSPSHPVPTRPSTPLPTPQFGVDDPEGDK